jgi:hypothetical protein
LLDIDLPHPVIHRHDAEFRELRARQDTSLFPREDQFPEIAARVRRDDEGRRGMIMRDEQ